MKGAHVAVQTVFVMRYVRFLRKRPVVGTNFCPVIKMLHKMRHKAGKKMATIFNVVSSRCSMLLQTVPVKLAHIFMPQSAHASCAPACVLSL